MMGYPATNNMTETQFDDDFETGRYSTEQDSEESFIQYYFFRGFEYKEIILLLLKNHGIERSLRTLKKRIKSYGLRRQQPEYKIDQVRSAVQTTIDGHGSLQGFSQVGVAHTTAKRHQSTARCCTGTSSRDGPGRLGIKKSSPPEEEDLSKPRSKLRVALRWI